MGEAIRRHREECALSLVREEEARKRALDLPTVAREYLDNAEAVGELRRSTLADYRYCMEARILRAPELVDKPLVDITPRDVRRWRDRLLREGASPRTANKLRQLLANVYRYAARPDSYGIELDPVSAVEKVREQRPGRINYFSPEEVEVLFWPREKVVTALRQSTRSGMTNCAGERSKTSRMLRSSPRPHTPACARVNCSRFGGETSTSRATRWASGAPTPQEPRERQRARSRGRYRWPRRSPRLSSGCASVAGSQSRTTSSSAPALGNTSTGLRCGDGTLPRARRQVYGRCDSTICATRSRPRRPSFFAPHEVQEFMGHADARTTRRYTHSGRDPTMRRG